MTLDGIPALNALSEIDKKRLHGKYYNDLLSLTRTAEWAKKQFKIKKLTRHHLSAFFHNNGWNVHPPNGRSVMPFRRDDYYDGDGKLAVTMIEDAYKDIANYMLGNGNFLDFITACWFFTGDTYQTFLDILDRNNHSTVSPDKDMDIVGNLAMNFNVKIDKKLLTTGAGIYEDILAYWLK